MKNLTKSLGLLIYSTPTPSSISYLWNFGSMLGFCLMIQLVSGVLLATHYKASLDYAFDSVLEISEEVSWGWVIRSMHANGASLFFLFVYLHIGRGMYIASYNNKLTWLIGVVMVLVLMGAAFLGYVLPWGQMSLWGATVITNLLSAVPYLGQYMVEWVWGGFSVSEPTLVRFFTIHFLLPFMLLALVLSHIIALHEQGSSNLLGIDNNSDKVYFYPLFVVKDVIGMILVLIFFGGLTILMGDLFMDPDNFLHANPLSTPPHIQPEWYFLFAYAILRSIPNKLGGVVALVLSILSLIFLSFGTKKYYFSLNKFIVIFFFSIFILLTWIGGMPVEYPLSFIGQILSVLYFLILIILMM